MIKKSHIQSRLRIKQRIAKKIRGTSERPRMTVYRSLHHLYAQIVDDTRSQTLLSASTLSKDLRERVKDLKDKKAVAKLVGKHLAEKALAQNLKKVVFDRNGYLYHGIVKSIADGAREAGLEF
ncbi:MAG: 50S ribosomal protein L18 [Ignavibacteriae bacterium]|nr:50S ribosomal protein L18 [Ignavibacteriota bacterium]